MPPVLLVHGIDDTERAFAAWVHGFRNAALEVHLLNLVPNDGKVGLDELANQFAAFIGSRFSGNQRFDIVAFSMGGLVSRYYLQRLGGVERVEKFISISAPHHGTWTAFLRANAGARQMRPGSEFLKDLANDAAILNRIRVTCDLDAAGPDDCACTQLQTGCWKIDTRQRRPAPADAPRPARAEGSASVADGER